MLASIECSLSDQSLNLYTLAKEFAMFSCLGMLPDAWALLRRDVDLWISSNTNKTDQTRFSQIIGGYHKVFILHDY